jgi:hypothetical protein
MLLAPATCAIQLVRRQCPSGVNLLEILVQLKITDTTVNLKA